MSVRAALPVQRGDRCFRLTWMSVRARLTMLAASVRQCAGTSELPGVSPLG